MIMIIPWSLLYHEYDHIYVMVIKYIMIIIDDRKKIIFLHTRNPAA